MTKKEKTLEIVKRLKQKYPNTKTALVFHNSWELLVATILSAQCTDKQVNKVTEKLFSVYPDGYAIYLANVLDIERYISSINYYHTKARHIKKMSEILIKKYNGEVPINLDQLLELPGVGYKTANVFLNDLYKANLGIAVDTHVKKTAIKYKLTKNSNPDKIAKDLEKIYPKEDWWKINRYFVLYGRYDFKKDLDLN